MVALQGSLLDPETAPRLAPPPWHFERLELGAGAWVEVSRGFLLGASELFGELLTTVPWEAESRWMYSRVVEVPRLTAHYGAGRRLPSAVLEQARDALSRRYGPELGEPFATVGLCCYRDGRDSVAWHGDTKIRGAREDTVVAIVSLGATRPFLLRPRGGGPSRRFLLGSGDLLAMGGSSQRTFEHAVPKTASAVGPRVSVQYRVRGVR